MIEQLNAHLNEPQWFFPFFIALWLGIGALLSFMSGWRSLVAYFRESPTAAPATEERFRFVSVNMGLRLFPVHYNNCLFVSVSDTGLRLSIFLPFRFLCPPLLIPWTAIASIEGKDSFLLGRRSILRLRDTWPVITVRGKAALAIAAAHERASGKPGS